MKSPIWDGSDAIKTLDVGDYNFSEVCTKGDLPELARGETNARDGRKGTVVVV